MLTSSGICSCCSGQAATSSLCLLARRVDQGLGKSKVGSGAALSAQRTAVTYQLTRALSASGELKAASSWWRQRRSLPYSFKTGTEWGASRQSLSAQQTPPGCDRSGDRSEGHPKWDSISNPHS